MTFKWLKFKKGDKIALDNLILTVLDYATEDPGIFGYTCKSNIPDESGEFIDDWNTIRLEKYGILLDSKAKESIYG